MIQEALEYIAYQLAHRGAGVPALLLSGGKESTLLLEMIARVGVKLDCIVFHDEFAGQERRLEYLEALASERDLHVVKWLPRARNFCKTSDGIDLVANYSLNPRGAIWIGTSTYDGVRECAIDWQNWPLGTNDEGNYGLLFHGGRADDSHEVFGEIPARETIVGSTKIVYPLFHWTEKDVWAAIKDLGVEYDKRRYDDGDLRATIDYVEMCSACLMGSDGVYCWKRCEVIDPQRTDWDSHHDKLRKGLFPKQKAE